MILAISKYGAMYLSDKMTESYHMLNNHRMLSIILHNAMFVRRDKRVTKYPTVYLSKKSIASIIELPEEFLPLHTDDFVGLYNRLIAFIIYSKIDCHINKMPLPIPIKKSGGDLK